MMAWPALAVLCLIMLCLELFSRSTRLNRWVMVIGILALMGLFLESPHVPTLYHRLLFSGASRVISQELVLATALGLTGILCTDRQPVSSSLLILSTAGGLVAVSAANWLVLFLGLETVNTGLYGLAGHWSRQRVGDEALLKFFILGTIFTAFEVAGIGLLGGTQGTLQILPGHGPSPILAAGESLLLAALLFKMGSFPFHLWAPDTYEGTPWPATTAIATLPKIVAGSLIIRLTGTGAFGAITGLPAVLETVALGTMVVGALGAWRQPRLKRMLAYAAISQVGFIILPLASGHTGAAGAYLVTYTIASLAVFSAAQALSGQDNPTRLDLVGSLNRPNRLPAVGLVVSLAAFAGFPFTLGMAAKLYSVEAVMTGPIVVWLGALLVTGFTFLYYFRWIYPLFVTGDMLNPKPQSRSILATSQITAFLILLFGIWGYPIVWLTRSLTF